VSDELLEKDGDLVKIGKQPWIPYSEGTKRFLAAQKILTGVATGVVDDNRISREVGINRQTVWSVKSELRRAGFTVPVAKKVKKSSFTTRPPTSPTPESSSDKLLEEATPPKPPPTSTEKATEEAAGEAASSRELIEKTAKRSLKSSQQEARRTRAWMRPLSRG